MKRMIFFALVGGLVGCVAIPSSQTNPVQGGSIVQGTNAAVCVVVPPDAVWEGSAQAGSGRSVAERVAVALKGIGKTSRLVSEVNGPSQQACAEKGTGLVLFPHILSWEDNATGYSGKPDRIEIRLALSSLGDPSAERTVVYEAKSNGMASAFLEWGNASPSGLLGKDFANAVARLFAQP